VRAACVVLLAPLAWLPALASSAPPACRAAPPVGDCTGSAVCETKSGSGAIVYACDGGAWRAREQRAVPGAATRQVATFATSGDGSSEHPWTGWEKAFDAIPATGGRIEFEKGFYAQAAPIKLPVELTDWLFVTGGPGVTITLSATAPRFLDPDLTADHQHVDKIWIEGFAIDAAGIGGKHHVVFGNYVGESGVGGFRRVNWSDIVVKDVHAFGLPVDRTTSTHRGAVYIVSVHQASAEPVRDAITNIDLEDIVVDGGNWGILVDGNGPKEADAVNVDIDNVWLVRCRHSTGARQSPSFPSSNFQIGEKARVGRVFVADCYGRFAGDTGLELNSTAFARVTNTVIEDAAVADFYYTNYNTPPREPSVLWDHCRAAITGTPSPGDGFGWKIINSYGSIPAGGRFKIVSSRYERSGTSESAASGAAVSTAGKISELSIESSEFSLAGAELSGLKFSPRVLEVNFASDLTFRLRDVTVRAKATRASGTEGLYAIVGQAAAAGKTLTLDWNNVTVSTDIAGPPVDYTVATASLYSLVPTALAGTISRYRVDSATGDAKACAINIDLAHQTIAGSLAIDRIDATRLPAQGVAVRFNHAQGNGEEKKVKLTRIKKAGP
jgi:hypothetical protein